MAGRARWWGIGRRIAPPRFVAFALLLLAGLPIGVTHHGWAHGTMLSFDLAAAMFLASVAPLLRGAEAAAMRRTARDNDANRPLLLAITAVTSIAILVAVASEVAGRPDAGATALVIATLVLAWLFSNTVYALHYAHLYYLPGKDGDAGGLDFPSCDEPDYWDFVYFSFTLGMTFQTSDVSIATRQLRRVAIGQCLAAFVFNLGVLAFTINVLGN